MTDISELVQRIKAAAVRAKTATEEYASGHMSVSVCYAECEEFNRLTDGPDNILALTAALEKAQARIAELEAIRIAAEKLVRCKGRYHSEQNYRALAAMFGVTTPNLPPIDEEVRAVKLPKPHAHLIWIQAGHAPDDFWDDVMVSHSEKDRSCDGSERYPVYARWEIEEVLKAAGIKWESE